MGLLDRFRKPEGGGNARPSDPDLARLIADLASADVRTRIAAARRLGDLGAQALPAQAALEEAISDDDGEVCLAASDALSRIRKAAL